MADEWPVTVTQFAVLDMCHLQNDAGSGFVRRQSFFLMLQLLARAATVLWRCSWVASAREPFCELF